LAVLRRELARERADVDFAPPVVPRRSGRVQRPFRRKTAES
jgi:hypothetical protein